MHIFNCDQIVSSIEQSTFFLKLTVSKPVKFLSPLVTWQFTIFFETSLHWKLSLATGIESTLCHPTFGKTILLFLSHLLLGLPRSPFLSHFPSTLYRRRADRFIYRPSPYRAVNTFHLGYKNQSVYAVSGTSRCLFSDKYKTHKYSVGQSVQLLNVKPVGASRDR